MSDAAASTAAAAPASPAPANATDTSVPVPADSGGDEKAPDPEAELEAHVQHAVRVGKRKEAAKKASETRAEKKAAPAKPLGTAPAPAAEKDEAESGTETKQEPARSGRTPRQLLEAGDIEGAFKEAFGKAPGDFNISSKRWEEHRKVVQRDRQKLEQRAAALSQREGQYQQLITKAREEVRPFLEYRKAQELYRSGDIAGALKIWTGGDDVTAFNRQLLSTFRDKDPEVDEVRAELRRMREEREQERLQYQQQIQQQQVEQQRRAFFNDMAQQISDCGNPALAALASKPKQLVRVFQKLEEHYDAATQTTLPILEAAEMVRREIDEEYSDFFGPRDAGAPAVPARGGSTPAKQSAQAGRTLSQQGAAEAAAPPKGAHGKSLDEQIREVQAQFGLTG